MTNQQSNNEIAEPNETNQESHDICQQSGNESNQLNAQSIQEIPLKTVSIDISINKYESPAQPIIDFPKRSFGKQLRTFNKNWYQNRFWLEYSVSKDSAFCYVCRHFNTENREKLFTEIGFDNWKSALEKNKGILKHENSKTHKIALYKYDSFIATTKKSSIVDLIDNNRAKLIQENRHYIKTIAKIILNLAISECALRGETEISQSLHEGNFLLWLNTIANYDNVIKNKLQNGPLNAKYTSPKIQNEIIEIFRKLIQNKIITEVKDSQYYTLIADGTRDISKQELMSIVLRYVHDKKIKEMF